MVPRSRKSILASVAVVAAVVLTGAIVEYLGRADLPPSGHRGDAVTTLATPQASSNLAEPCDSAAFKDAFDRSERPRYADYDAIGFELIEASCIDSLALTLVIRNEANGQPRGTHQSQAMFRRSSGQWELLARNGPSLLIEDVTTLGVLPTEFAALQAALGSSQLRSELPPANMTKQKVA